MDLNLQPDEQIRIDIYYGLENVFLDVKSEINNECLSVSIYGMFLIEIRKLGKNIITYSFPNLYAYKKHNFGYMENAEIIYRNFTPIE